MSDQVKCPQCGNTKSVHLNGPAYVPPQQPCFVCGNCGNRFASNEPEAWRQNEYWLGVSRSNAKGYTR